MSNVTIEPKAYLKIMLHAAKYPYCAVNGVLLASRGGKKSVIVDVVPLFHQCLHVTPMAEIALVQIESLANEADLSIAGYYTAPENFYECTIEKAPGSKIADKIAENVSSAYFVLVDNKLVTMNQESPALKVWQSIEGHWAKTSFAVTHSDFTLETTSALLKRGASKDLFDFDNYLDNTENDWTNSHLDVDLSKLLTMY